MELKFSTTGYLGSSENKSYTVDEFEHISNQASDALTSACENFGKSSDFQNYALCQANLGRLLRVKSRCRISENEFELSVEEEGDLRSSIGTAILLFRETTSDVNNYLFNNNAS